MGAFMKALYYRTMQKIKGFLDVDLCISTNKDF